MRAGASLLAVSLLAAFPAAAQRGTLQPDAPAVFGGSTAMYHAVLAEAFDVASGMEGRCWGGVQMIQLRPFTPEQSTGICRVTGAFVAHAADAAQNVWYAGSDTTGVGPWSTERARAVRVGRAETRIDSALAARVVAAWDRAVRTARFPPRTEFLTISLDDVTTYFASRTGAGATASVWGTSPETLAGTLVSLGEQVGAFARGEATSETLGQACSRVEALLPDETNP